MENLPLEVLQAICELLVSSEPRRYTLLAFALASKTCYLATTREKFSRISIKASNPENLLKEAKGLREALALGDRKRYVRKVKITGGIPSAVWTTKRGKTRPTRLNKVEIEEAPVNFSDDDEDPFSDVPMSRLKERYKGPNRDLTFEEQLRYNETWQLLADCLFETAITDLIWASNDRVPPCIVSALHNKRPGCRLHVHTFHLPSLYYHKYKPMEVDGDDYTLATSPCLYSIAAACPPWDHRGRSNYNHAAILQIASGLAPNLRNLRLRLHEPMKTKSTENAMRGGQPSWLGFWREDRGIAPLPPGSQGSLATLMVEKDKSSRDGQYSEVSLQYWEGRVNFAHLRSLHLSYRQGVASLQRLTTLANNGTFGLLRDLNIVAASDYWGRTHIPVDIAFEHFLSALPPLTSLSVGGMVGEGPFNAILIHHGSSLLTFGVADKILTVDHVHRVKESCTDLQDLTLEMIRYEGGSQEVEMYRALGNITIIRKLTLKFHLTHLSPSDVSGLIWNLRVLPFKSEQAEQDTRSFLRSIFINAAIDEDLARAIFHSIYVAGGRPSIASKPNLVKLRIEVVPSHEIEAHKPIQHLVHWLCRRWACDRDPRADSPEFLKKTRLKNTRASSLLQIERQRRDPSGPLLIKELVSTFRANFQCDEALMSGPCKQVWDELWPRQKRIGSENCCSFPLVADKVEEMIS
ncbi:hypothetical protein BKA63DRAFT_294077 [Paraphoma chrysanthemicola]|nr:hypothetical protein BKA63DRAFT_294077 [Paraphoma chrysanthemicola]